MLSNKNSSACCRLWQSANCWINHHSLEDSYNKKIISLSESCIYRTKLSAKLILVQICPWLSDGSFSMLCVLFFVCTLFCFYKNITRDMAQQLKQSAVLVENPSSVPSTLAGQITSNCNSRLQGSNTLSAPCGHQQLCTYVHLNQNKINHLHKKIVNPIK